MIGALLLKRLAIYALPAIVGGALVFGAFRFVDHYNTLRDNVATLRSNNTQLEQIIENKNSDLQELEARILEERQRIVELNLNNQDLREDISAYLDIFRRHDLTQLSRAKPGLIEPRINKGTQDVFRQLEAETSPDPISND